MTLHRAGESPSTALVACYFEHRSQSRILFILLSFFLSLYPDMLIFPVSAKIVHTNSRRQKNSYRLKGNMILGPVRRNSQEFYTTETIFSSCQENDCDEEPIQPSHHQTQVVEDRERLYVGEWPSEEELFLSVKWLSHYNRICNRINQSLKCHLCAKSFQNEKTLKNVEMASAPEMA